MSTEYKPEGPQAPIDSCPHCGSTEGYYTKERPIGTVYCRYNYDGSEADNGEMYDYLSYKGGKNAYCAGCRKFLFKMNKLKGDKRT